MNQPLVESPCIGVCVLDAQSICTGCGRSIAEITEWSQAGNPRRLTVIENSRRRLAMAAPLVTESRTVRRS